MDYQQRLERANAMKNAYLSGMTLKEIAPIYDLTPERIRQILDWIGCPRRAGSSRWDAMSPEKQETLRERHRQRMAHIKGRVFVEGLTEAVEMVRNGASYSQAGAAHGLSRNSIAGACHRAGVKSVRPQIAGHGKTLCDWPSVLADAKERGLTITQVAHSVGCGISAASKAADRHGVILRDGVLGIPFKDRLRQSSLGK